MKKTSLLAVATVIASTNFASAAFISIAPGNVTASSEIATCCADRDPADIVNFSGRTGTAGAGGTHNVTPGNMWLSTGNGFGGVDPDPWVQFDLGAVYTINSFHVWNYNEVQPNFPDRGVNAVSVQYGTTPALGSTVGGITNFARATGLNDYTGETFNTFTPFNARYIKFDIDSNHGDGATFYGLSEVEFDGVLVPEPSAFALFGLAGLGLLLRRRR